VATDRRRVLDSGCGGGLKVNGFDRRCSVHASPFQYRSWSPPSGSKYQPGSGPAEIIQRLCANRRANPIRAEQVRSRDRDCLPLDVTLHTYGLIGSIESMIGQLR
jgi:hypothetical protein